MKWIVLLIGTATVACHARCERAVLLLFVKYSTWSEYSLRWLWALVGIHVGWPNTAASDGLS